MPNRPFHQGSPSGNRPHGRDGNRRPRDQNGGRQGRGRDDRSRTPQPLTPRSITYWVNDRPNPALMDEDADRVAQELVGTELKSTQLRRYYDEVNRLRGRLVAESQGRDREAAFDILRADFKMLKAKAFYAHGREQNRFPLSLLQFFTDHIHSVSNARDFEVFCKHFEAVVAFHKYYRPRD